jgi:hypothetical protein
MRLLALLVFVHSFYSAECCANKHCHPVPCGEISTTATGFTWNAIFFDRSVLKVSQDGDCHVCVENEAYGRCIYLPPRV